ncbi:6-phosphogluconate dehydrogenase [Lutimonas zeaxanthinifaciens]|uniref:6-phosphogluconate dehydrogenase n=1 Tax=Lutimonas zeaxanthinifaciens TaxID=3060215 RepID=UPI00265D20FE|nr:6-phosphogluconate dehydrogenase [Lutimonas sp. YSD2104]WKK66027.1 6-phosphogluconate dehydrogenase [Lutimonas sp. YSD2104]
MNRFFKYAGISILLVFLVYILFIYFVTFSEGYRAGELIKISKRGLIFKTWEGRLSQGVSEEQQFNFSVQKSDKEVLEKLKEFQGKRVKLTYIERFGTFFWLGDTKYYVKEVEILKKDSELMESQ